MKWKSKRQKEKELRIAAWEALPSIDALFSDRDLDSLRALRAKPPLSLDQRFSVEDIRKLQQNIHGKVILPTDITYHRDRQTTVLSVQEFPQLIIFCEIFEDVGHSLAFARKYDLPVAIRSGGHNTGGFSVNCGLVIDVSRINDIVVDVHGKRVIAGAGATIGDLNARLNLYRLHVPTGNCHDVCIGGFMQGGGYGFSSRKFGMNCDNVIEVLVMLANGRLVVANDTRNSDLFWGIRGGTGGNFGVLLQITYKLHQLRDVWGFGLEWPLDGDDGIDHAAAALVEMQANYMRSGHSGADKELGYLTLATWQNDIPVLLMRGMYLGPKQLGESAIDPIRKLEGTNFKDFGVGPYSKLDQELTDGLPSVPDLAREEKESGYISQPLSKRTWAQMLEIFLKSPNRSSLICIEPYGGAISATQAGMNAFVHRAVDMDLFLDVFWMSEDQQRTDAIAFLDRFMANMARHFNGESYQNYPRRGQTDFRRRYWGRWFENLLAVKKKYDPGNFFQYAQSISPETQSAKIDSEPLLPSLRAAIVYEDY
jgi:FAD/FMN-containing dehydrogenase